MSTKRRGRPPRNGVRASRRLEIGLTVDEWRTLRRYAEETGTSVADAIRLHILDLSETYAEEQSELSPVTKDPRC